MKIGLLISVLWSSTAFAADCAILDEVKALGLQSVTSKFSSPSTNFTDVALALKGNNNVRIRMGVAGKSSYSDDVGFLEVVGPDPQKTGNILVKHNGQQHSLNPARPEINGRQIRSMEVVNPTAKVAPITSPSQMTEEMVTRIRRTLPEGAHVQGEVQRKLSTYELRSFLRIDRHPRTGELIEWKGTAPYVGKGNPIKIGDDYYFQYKFDGTVEWNAHEITIREASGVRRPVPVDAIRSLKQIDGGIYQKLYTNPRM